MIVKSLLVLSRMMWLGVSCTIIGYCNSHLNKLSKCILRGFKTSWGVQAARTSNGAFAKKFNLGGLGGLRCILLCKWYQTINLHYTKTLIGPQMIPQNFLCKSMIPHNVCANQMIPHNWVLTGFKWYHTIECANHTKTFIGFQMIPHNLMCKSYKSLLTREVSSSVSRFVYPSSE